MDNLVRDVMMDHMDHLDNESDNDQGDRPKENLPELDLEALSRLSDDSDHEEDDAPVQQLRAELGAQLKASTTCGAAKNGS